MPANCKINVKRAYGICFETNATTTQRKNTIANKVTELK